MEPPTPDSSLSRREPSLTPLYSPPALQTPSKTIKTRLPSPHTNNNVKVVNKEQCYESFADGDGRNDKSPETRQVVFAKVHKAASSTVQNILLRFAMARNLSVLLPRNGPVLSQTSSKMERSRIVPHIQSKQLYDILCSHVLYEAKEIDKYFPKNAFRVAIIREPMKQTLSALAYYTVKWKLRVYKDGYKKHQENPKAGFLKHPEDFSGGKQCPPFGSYIGNRMIYDLGLGMNKVREIQKNKTKLVTFLKKLETEFDLILISDYFEQSMVLLKRSLKWSMKDILFIKVNEMHLDANSTWRKKPNVTTAEMASFRNCSEMDYALYEHFSAIFLQKIGKEDLFEEEVTAYRSLLESVRDFCRNPKSGQKLEIPKSEWTDGFSVRKCECDLMRKSEDDMVDLARKRQMWLHKQYILSHQQLPTPAKHDN
ncbi:hypothetical protein EGW08_008745 [Elysia chlorotica]|uniref:Uncharacterized protein n=1 Tax=Elysia chlorotica TaxID=188477 RepID=A0A433TPJ0_ELYCH|nr:hypothetical protein EGW08_008745 [Elysia chlorotica]